MATSQPQTLSSGAIHLVCWESISYWDLELGSSASLAGQWTLGNLPVFISSDLGLQVYTIRLGFLIYVLRIKLGSHASQAIPSPPKQLLQPKTRSLTALVLSSRKGVDSGDLTCMQGYLQIAFCRFMWNNISTGTLCEEEKPMMCRNTEGMYSMALPVEPWKEAQVQVGREWLHSSVLYFDSAYLQEAAGVFNVREFSVQSEDKDRAFLQAS